jgi:hypothetical protein
MLSRPWLSEIMRGSRALPGVTFPSASRGHGRPMQDGARLIRDNAPLSLIRFSYGNDPPPPAPLMT